MVLALRPLITVLAVPTQAVLGRPPPTAGSERRKIDIRHRMEIEERTQTSGLGRRQGTGGQAHGWRRRWGWGRPPGSATALCPPAPQASSPWPPHRRTLPRGRGIGGGQQMYGRGRERVKEGEEEEPRRCRGEAIWVFFSSMIDGVTGWVKESFFFYGEAEGDDVAYLNNRETLNRRSHTHDATWLRQIGLH